MAETATLKYSGLGATKDIYIYIYIYIYLFIYIYIKKENVPAEILKILLAAYILKNSLTNASPSVHLLNKIG